MALGAEGRLGAGPGAVGASLMLGLFPPLESCLGPARFLADESVLLQNPGCESTHGMGGLGSGDREGHAVILALSSLKSPAGI